MPSLEYVVRPYQSPNAHGTIQIPSAPASSNQRATLVWGAKATMPAVNMGENFSVVCCKERLNEQDRQSDTVRITQQDNSDNYVDVARPNTLHLQKHDANNCGDNWDQFSGVGAEISDTLAAFQSDVLSGTAAQPGNCDTTWKFKNQ
jgi:hypothetical protein